MSTLHCSVTDCITNKGGCCCRPSIQVEGPMAAACDQTICHSYSPKGGAQNNGDCYCTPNNTLDIGCSVCKCGYNKNSKCDSSSVSIDCGPKNSHCATFKA